MIRIVQVFVGLTATLGASALVATVGIRHAMTILGFGTLVVAAFGFVAWELWRHGDEIGAVLRGERIR